MNLLAVVSGILCVAGLLIIGIGWRKRTKTIPMQLSTTLWKNLCTRWGQLSRTRRLMIYGSLVVGLIATLVTQWILFLFLIPAIAIGLPWLLGDPPNYEVKLLAALDRWISLISSSLPMGKSIRDAIRSTRKQVPDLLQRPVALLLNRLDDNWSARDAFFVMADELHSPNADVILAALVLAAERGGTGALTTLQALSENTQEHLRADREIATERAKPRIIVRQVTMISMIVLGAAFILGREFFAPYRSGIGFIVLASLLTCYLLSLLVLRRMTTPPNRKRLIVWEQ